MHYGFLDGDNGTQSIQSKDLANSLLSTLTTQELLGHVDISELESIKPGDISENDSHYFIAGSNADGYKKLSFFNSIFLPIDTMGSMAIGNRRRVWRASNIGNYISNEQYESIADGTFYNMFIGDYWQINGVTWRIADFDYWYKKGNNTATTCNNHHVVIMPDQSLGSIRYTESGVSLTNGYFGSSLRNKIIGDIIPNIVEPVFGTSHIMPLPELICNSANNGVPTAVVWVNDSGIAPNQIMVCGSNILSPTNYTTPENGSDTVDSDILALFSICPLIRYIRRADFLLRDIRSSTEIILFRSTGAISSAYSTTNYPVCPVFAIC